MVIGCFQMLQEPAEFSVFYRSEFNSLRQRKTAGLAPPS
jgi:hypothetical protein